MCAVRRGGAAGRVASCARARSRSSRRRCARPPRVDSSNGCAAEREAGVVDEDVDAAELRRPRRATKRAQLAGSVTSSGSATSVSSRSTRRAPPATRTPCLGEHARGRLPEAGRGAGDDRRLTGEVGARWPMLTAWRMPSRTSCARRATWSTWSVVWCRPKRSSSRRCEPAPRVVAVDAGRRRGRARRAPGSRSSPSRRGGRAPRRRRPRRRARARPRPGRSRPATPRGRSGRTRAAATSSSGSSAPRRGDRRSGRSRFQPVTRTSPPAIAVPTKAARSVATWRNAPRTFRLVAVGPREHERRGEVDGDAGERDDEHDAAVHVRRRDEAADAGVDDPRRATSSSVIAVRLRGEDLRPAEPERPRAARGPRREPRGDERGRRGRRRP